MCPFSELEQAEVILTKGRIITYTPRSCGNRLKKDGGYYAKPSPPQNSTEQCKNDHLAIASLLHNSDEYMTMSH